MEHHDFEWKVVSKKSLTTLKARETKKSWVTANRYSLLNLDEENSEECNEMTNINTIAHTIAKDVELEDANKIVKCLKSKMQVREE